MLNIERPRMPTRSEFISRFLEAVFPDIQNLGFEATGYGYTQACSLIARELGVDNDQDNDAPQPQDSLFQLAVGIAGFAQGIGVRNASMLVEKHFVEQSPTVAFLTTFCDPYSGSLRGWLKQENGRIYKSFEAAVFMTHLLLSRPVCRDTCPAFLEYCLNVLGLHSFSAIIKTDIKELQFSPLISAKQAPISNTKRVTLTIGFVVFTILSLIGGDKAKDREVLERLHEHVSNMYEEEVMALAALSAAEDALIRDIKYFDPRSIQTKKAKLLPEDFFVQPLFCDGSGEHVSPLSGIVGADKSKRLIVEAKTGMGKTMYLRMVSLCTLRHRLDNDTRLGRLAEIAGLLEVPEDKYLIFIPARMFSFCFSDARYKSWTNDFITLYFNSVFKLSGSYDFYTGATPQRFSVEPESSEITTYALTVELTRHLKELARSGKLLLILDSFDEIPLGEMRKAYVKAIARFYDEYCCYPELEDVGAHVLIASREMSPETMNLLAQALSIGRDKEIYRMSTLEPERRDTLIRNWNRLLGRADTDTIEMIRVIESNHYYREYARNPYMLSVACFFFGRDLGNITQNYISTLIDKTRRHYRVGDGIIDMALQSIPKMLQDIALQTILSTSAFFSRHELEKYLRSCIDKSELTGEQIEESVLRLHEVFVTEVGLIVPADGHDSSYQFINSRIRYELAAKAIQRELRALEDKSDIYRRILSSRQNSEEYIGLLVPLLCDINIENVRLSEMLVMDLALRDFRDKDDDRILLRGMLDLVLSRYGSSVVTFEEPGDRDEVFVRKSQRILMLRLLSSPNSELSVEEMQQLVLCPAFLACKGWIKQSLLRPEMMQADSN